MPSAGSAASAVANSCGIKLVRNPVGRGRAALLYPPAAAGITGRGAAGEVVPRPGELPAKPDSLERLPCLPRRFGGAPAWERYAAWCLLALHDASLILDGAADEVRSQPLCPVW